jgi:hypothetical protein
MTTPAIPLRLKILDRLVAVLTGIVTGADYFYTPAEVLKRLVAIDECSGFPVYMVFPVPGGPIEHSGAPDGYDEDMEILIKGYVKDTLDPVTKAERCLRDVRRAINEDSKSGVAGTLGVLAVETRIEASPETEFSIDGFGGFDQRIRVKITGTFGTL